MSNILGEPMGPQFKALPDDEGVDRIEVDVVPRYKTSGMSGDEWRVSGRVRMWRKGELVREEYYGSMNTAVAALPWLWQIKHEESPMPL